MGKGKNKDTKPEKPYPDFPLFPHATKRWAKKIRGKLHYFGPWEQPEKALEKFQEERDDLYAGRVPRGRLVGLTMRDLANHFLTSKKRMQQTGELTARTFADYLRVSQIVISFFGLDRLVSDVTPKDFEELRAEIAKTNGAVTLGNTIQRIRSIFKYGYDSGLIETPVRYGQSFRRPSRRILRKLRYEKGARMFEAEQIRTILAYLDAQAKEHEGRSDSRRKYVALRAMFLLGINCGFGNHDVATLPIKACDLAGGWIDFPRPKTAIHRRCPLWPETVQAIKAAVKVRVEPNDPSLADRVFLTRTGGSWSKAMRSEFTPPEDGDHRKIKLPYIDDPIAKETAKMLTELNLKRPGLSFYALRHTFETIAGESRDQVAVDAVMGHVRDDMASVYRERISDERLRAASDFVREWLFGTKENG